ncbi:MAG: PhoH family protein [Arenicellales bacterium]
MSKPITFQLHPAESDRLSQLCGQQNANLEQIESYLGVKITQRNNAFSVSGGGQKTARAESVIRRLFELTSDESQPINRNQVHIELSRVEVNEEEGDRDGEEASEEIVLRLRKHVIRGQNPRQRDYLRRIVSNDINFGVGPAGTGKTYLAVACAVAALADNEIERILLVRPAVEAGEKLGFLPGDIGQKIDPYLRPLFDALYEMLGFERVGKLIARGTIELAPLAYMRGRTLNESFVILDEAQNTTVEQMKMFLTRIGFGSKAIITGDITQIDLPRGQYSGLKHASTVLSGIDGISFTRFLPRDVVRHPLVQRIVEAYEQQASEEHLQERG